MRKNKSVLLRRTLFLRRVVDTKSFKLIASSIIIHVEERVGLTPTSAFFRHGEASDVDFFQR